jgi:hypothetical protein
MDYLFRIMGTANNLLCCQKLNQLSLRYNLTERHWRSTDADGNTLLHIASSTRKDSCVTFLMQQCPYLTQTRNDKGDLPEGVFELCLKAQDLY